MLTAHVRMWLQTQINEHRLNTSSVVGLELHPGIDPDPQIRDLFGKARTWTTRHVLGDDLPLDHRYDVVTLIESIGRLQYPTSLVADLTEIVKPGGLVLCSWRVPGGMLPPGVRPSDSTGLIWKPQADRLRQLFVFGGFDQIGDDTDYAALPPGWLAAYQRRTREFPPLVAYGSYREGDEVPDVPQTEV